MPIYEYICKPCEESFEALLSISRANEARCPKCGSGDLKRVMSMFSARTSGGDSSHASSCAGCASGQCGSCNCHH